MSEIAFRFTTLTFISSQEEIERQIKNTIVLSHVLDKYGDEMKLGRLLESTQYGYTASATDEGNCRFLRITDMQEGGVDWEEVPFCNCDQKEKYLLCKGDVLVARTGGTTGKSHMITEVAEDTVFASYLIRLRTKEDLVPDYLYLFLNSYAYWPQITELKRGSAQPNVNAQKLKELMIPYCPIDEQRKIVSLVNGNSLTHADELKERIDDSIEKFNLNIELSGLFSEQTTLVRQLRQSILQEVVQGKLVPQDPNDEPASELLGRIRERKSVAPIGKEEIPYILPSGWIWERLGGVADIIMGQSPPGSSYNTAGEGVPLINGPVEFGPEPFSETIKAKYTTKPTKFCREGDLLICVRGSTTGRTKRLSGATLNR